MNTVLDAIARHLDAFSDLSTQDRAQIFHAWDVAPEQSVDQNDSHAWMQYCHHAGRQWELARAIPLHTSYHRLYGGLEGVYALTLDGVAGGASAPTKQEILTVLARAVDRAKEMA